MPQTTDSYARMMVNDSSEPKAVSSSASANSNIRPRAAVRPCHHLASVASQSGHPCEAQHFMAAGGRCVPKADLSLIPARVY